MLSIFILQLCGHKASHFLPLSSLPLTLSYCYLAFCFWPGFGSDTRMQAVVFLQHTYVN